MPNSKDSDNFCHLAKEFWTAYLLLEDKEPTLVHYFFAKSFLICRAIELIFKAELAYRGVPLKKLASRRDAGHDLVKLLNLLEYPQNYSRINSTTFDAIKIINPYYSEKVLEYMTQDDIQVQNIKFLENFVEDFFRTVLGPNK